MTTSAFKGTIVGRLLGQSIEQGPKTHRLAAYRSMRVMKPLQEVPRLLNRHLIGVAQGL